MSTPSQRKADTYSLRRIQSTPFPNRLLDAVLTLPETQARVVCLVVRLTLGWSAGRGGERRASVGLSYARILKAIGRRSPTAVGRAVEALVGCGMLEVLADSGERLETPAERRRYHRALRYRLAPGFVEEAVPGVHNPVENRDGTA